MATDGLKDLNFIKGIINKRIVLFILLNLAYLPLLVLTIIGSVYSGFILNDFIMVNQHNIYVAIIYALIFICLIIANFFYIYFLYKILISIIQKSQTIKEISVKKHLGGYLLIVFIFLFAITTLSIWSRAYLKEEMDKVVDKMYTNPSPIQK